MSHTQCLTHMQTHWTASNYLLLSPIYLPNTGGTSKSKRAKFSTHKQKVAVMLYDKVCDIISNISELLEIQLLTDTTILQVRV